MRLAALPDDLQGLVDRVDGPDVDAALALCRRLTDLVPLPADGRTAQRWQLLAALAERDLTTARVAEAHLDAVAILAEAHADSITVPADLAPAGATWGVYAAEGPGVRLDAKPLADPDDGWSLTGTKPWCSLAGQVSHALVTAHTDDGRRLFAVRLDHPGVAVDTSAWRSRGLVDVPSGPVTFDAVPAAPVGAAGWYLRRPGFAHGGIGVAACWWGGAVGVARALLRAAGRREPDQLATWHVGSVDLALERSRAVLSSAARAVDRGAAAGSDGEVLAARARAVVADSAEEVLRTVGHALGPAPLALDDDHARRVADLTVYLRQHHAERDVARLGEQLLAAPAQGEAQPW